MLMPGQVEPPVKKGVKKAQQTKIEEWCFQSH
jgi:hypothetical protein